MIATVPVALLYVAAARGQTADSRPSFEVASVKPSPPPGPNRTMGRLVRGGPGSTGPGAITFTNIDLFSLVTMAYGVNAYQLVGPGWLGATRFDITAKLPPGATREQYRLMLQNLLAERFKLAVHRDKKEGRVFDLAVAKNGPKLKESADDPAAAADDGSLQPPPSAPRPPVGYNGPMALLCARCSIEQFTARLAGLLGQPVSDATGLNGRYDIRLQYSLAGLQTGPSVDADVPATIFDALQEQLGLKLEPKRGMIDLLAIDHIEKVPTEN
jgi:uncharacterized protein (TIGR03435 family)